MASATGRTFDREEVLGRFHELFMARYAQLERGEKEAIQHDYRLRMYRLGERHPYRLPDGTLFEATMRGSAPRERCCCAARTARSANTFSAKWSSSSPQRPDLHPATRIRKGPTGTPPQEGHA